jgi:hypothetical protein
LAFNDLNRLSSSGQAVLSRGLSFAFFVIALCFPFFATAFGWCASDLTAPSSAVSPSFYFT